MRRFPKSLTGCLVFKEILRARNKRLIALCLAILFATACETVRKPPANLDKAPVITITVYDKTHGTSTVHQADGDTITVPAGTLLQFIVVARNTAGGAKVLTFYMADPERYLETRGPADDTGDLPVQLNIVATNENQQITNTYSEEGKTYIVSSVASNYNGMATFVTLKIIVEVPSDPYTRSCGTFDLSAMSNKPYNFPVPEMKTTLSFALQPNKCNQAFSCSSVAFVQMIRFIDQTGGHAGEYFQPSGDQGSRMIGNNSNPDLNGWAIDRTEGRKWAYLSRLDDGSWDAIQNDPVDWHIQLGSNGQSAIVKDGIHSDKSKYRVDVVTVPICVDADPTTNDQIFGYFGFSFSRPENADQLLVPTEDTYNWMPQAFDLAVSEWNKQGDKEKLRLRRIP